MRILWVGDVVGSPGRRVFAQVAGRMRREQEADVIVVNAENAAGGRGLTPALADELFAAGADIITLGDHVWDQKELAPHLDLESRIVRPLNFAPGCPGRGWTTRDTPVGRLTVISLIGRVFMPPMDCPFRTIDAFLKRGADLGLAVLVEVHAEATSEKIALGRYLDGRVSAVAGTHTHVPTADEQILPKGTAYITDLGMTGPRDSVIGTDAEAVLKRFLTGMPVKFEIPEGDVSLEGALIHLDPKTGRARSIRRVREKLKP